MGLFDSYFDPNGYTGVAGLFSRLAGSNFQLPVSRGFDPTRQDVADYGQTSNIPIGNYMMPAFGTPDPAQLPMNAQATQGQLAPVAPQAVPAPQQGGFMTGFQNWATTPVGNPMAALANGIRGFTTGQTTDPTEIAMQERRQRFGALVSVLGPKKALIAINDPEAGKLMLQDALGKHDYGFQALPDGTVLRQDPRSGTVEPVYSGGTKPTFGVISESDGGKTYGWIDAGKRVVEPLKGGESEKPATVAGPDGKPIAIPPGVDRKTFVNEVSRANAKAAAGEKTEVQAKSEKFANKMENAEKNLQGIDDQGASFFGRASEGSDWVPGSAGAGRYLQTNNYQKYKQARDNFITALLRDESGAAIGTEEFKRYERELFPMPGDGDAVIKQKREARRIAIAAMKKGAGPGYKSPDYAGGEASADPLGLR